MYLHLMWEWAGKALKEASGGRDRPLRTGSAGGGWGMCPGWKPSCPTSRISQSGGGGGGCRAQGPGTTQLAVPIGTWAAGRVGRKEAQTVCTNIDSIGGGGMGEEG